MGGPRRWLLLLPVCALLLWAVLPLARDADPRGAEGGPPPLPGPQQRELAPRAVTRAARGQEPARTTEPNRPSAQLPVPDSAREAVKQRFDQQLQVIELRNTERFAQAEAAFAATPPGDGPQREAAAEREHKLRSALGADGAAERVRSIECRDPLCKLEIAAPEPMAEPIGSGLHFTREAGVQTASAFRGEGEARWLTVYVVRDGASFESLSAQHSQ